MKWIGERISVKEQKTKTTVVIYPEKKPMVTGLMGAWLAMWFAIGISCVWYYFIAQFTQQEKIILFIFMTFWTYYAIRVLRSFFWMMWGNEYFKIDETAFTSKKSIRGFGKAVPYYLENIKKMSISIPKENSLQAVWESSPWVKGGERLEFEYLGKNIRFARKLNEKDSKLLFQLITKRIEEQLKQKMKNMDKYD